MLGIYPRRTATNTLDVLERLIEETLFPIQRIQTERALEFFAETVQRRLMDWPGRSLKTPRQAIADYADTAGARRALIHGYSSK